MPRRFASTVCSEQRNVPVCFSDVPLKEIIQQSGEKLPISVFRQERKRIRRLFREGGCLPQKCVFRSTVAHHCAEFINDFRRIFFQPGQFSEAFLACLGKTVHCFQVEQSRLALLKIGTEGLAEFFHVAEEPEVVVAELERDSEIFRITAERGKRFRGEVGGVQRDGSAALCGELKQARIGNSTSMASPEIRRRLTVV